MTGRKRASTNEIRTKGDFIYLMGKFRNGTATRKDAETLWFILMEDELNPGVSGEGDS